MKSKFKYLIEAGIVSAPNALGSAPTFNKPVSSQTSALGGDSAQATQIPVSSALDAAKHYTTRGMSPTDIIMKAANNSYNMSDKRFTDRMPPAEAQSDAAVAPVAPSVSTSSTTSQPTTVNNNPNPFTVAPAPQTTNSASSTAKPVSDKKSKESPGIFASLQNLTRSELQQEVAAGKTQYAVNRQQSEKDREKFADFQARKQERANIIAKTKQAEAEAAAAEPQTQSGSTRTSTATGTGTSGRRIFENNMKMQFKPDALKSLLELQEAGIVDAISSGASSAWDWVKQNVPYVKTATQKVKNVASDTWKYTTNPASAAKTMIKYTTPTAGESEAVRGLKTLVGYSPDTIARMQARRGAAASAFDTGTANEKLKHYEKMFTLSNPATLATSGIAGLVGALAGTKDKMGIGGKLATGIAGAAKDIADYEVKAQAKEAARQKFAREDDWRVLTR